LAALDLNEVQVVANCLDHDTAAAAASHIPKHLEPAAAQKLLLTAVARRHVRLWESLLNRPQVQQHIDAATCEAAIELVLVYEGYSVVQLVSCVVEQPAAAQLDADAVARLLP
jgi:hypothetical protein